MVASSFQAALCCAGHCDLRFIIYFCLEIVKLGVRFQLFWLKQKKLITFAQPLHFTKCREEFGGVLWISGKC